MRLRALLRPTIRRTTGKTKGARQEEAAAALWAARPAPTAATVGRRDGEREGAQADSLEACSNYKLILMLIL